MILKKVKVLVTQSCPTLFDPMDYSLPGSCIHGLLQARILEWVAMPFSRGSSWPRDWTHVSHISGRFFTIWATQDDLKYIQSSLKNISRWFNRLLSPFTKWKLQHSSFYFWGQGSKIAIHHSSFKHLSIITFLCFLWSQNSITAVIKPNLFL